MAELSMDFKKLGETIKPLAKFSINGSYIIGVYQGSLSEFDMLIRYRQKDANGGWSRLRTPKHIHWAVDMLIKLHENPKHTQQFLDFLITYWEHTPIIKNEREREAILNSETLLETIKQEAKQYEKLSQKGEYSIKFLILLAKLLMIQEKTNKEDAFMFGSLLEKLRKNKDIFSIISTATHNGK